MVIIKHPMPANIFYTILKKIIRPSGIYAGASIFNQAISFLMLPVLTRFLTPFHYGVLATFQTIYPMGESFIDMGSSAAVSREYFDTKDAPSSFGQYIFNSIVIKLSFSVIFLAILIFLRNWLIEKFNFPLWLIIAIPAVAFASAFIDIIIKQLIFKKKAYAYTIFQCSRTIINIVLSLLFVIAAGLNWKGRVLGISVTEMIFMLLCAVFLIRRNLLKYVIKPNLIKEILTFGMPLFLYSVGRWVITLSDRLFLNVMVSISATGSYSVGYSIASLIDFIAGGVGLAVMPILFEKLKNPSEAQKLSIVKYTYLYFFALFFVTLAWIYVAPIFFKIFIGKGFEGASRYIPLVSFAYFANAMFRVFSLYISYSKKTYYLIYAILISAGVNLALNYILIKANGPMGAAQSTLISYSINMFLVWFFMQRAYPMPWFYFLKIKREKLS